MTRTERFGQIFGNCSNYDIKVTSEYGNRYHPIKQQWIWHYGTDMTANGETAWILAPFTAKVIEVYDGVKGYSETEPSGNYITLEIKDSFVIRRFVFKHLAYNTIKVAVGQIVTQGDEIAYMGSTGLSTAAHLHLEYHASFDGGRVYNTYNVMEYMGKITNEVEEAPYQVKAPYTRDLSREITKGIMYSEVKELQIFLNENLALYQLLDVDGYYGVKTEEAVIQLQNLLGVVPTGIYTKSLANIINTKNWLYMYLNFQRYDGIKMQDVKDLIHVAFDDADDSIMDVLNVTYDKITEEFERISENLKKGVENLD